ncbi:MAG: outer membrane protein assembly factor BamD [Bradymonadia bacterium]
MASHTRTHWLSRGWITLVILLGSSMVLTACGGRGKPPESYAGSARYSYEQGAEALDDGDYLEAIRQFTFVKNKYPYSKFAALAELRIADAYFEQEKFAEAIQAYGTFVESRPNHEKVDYAMWRRALSHFEQIPSDFILFPPAHEKDQRATTEALRALELFVQRFPESKDIAEARERVRDCKGMLADHELYVARFYLRDKRPLSAVGRLEGVYNTYREDLPRHWSEAAYLLARTYEVLGRRAEAMATASALIKAYPDRQEAVDAEDFIAELN